MIQELVVEQAHGRGDAAPLVFKTQCHPGYHVRFEHWQCDKNIYIFNQKAGGFQLNPLSDNLIFQLHGGKPRKVHQLCAVLLAQRGQAVFFKGLFRQEGAPVGLAHHHLLRLAR